jgi:GTP cyclohydrolase IB
MEDVQNRPDSRHMSIDKVGVSDLLFPIVVLDKEHRTQQTVARVSISVDLPEDFKGTHMSRFIEILNQYRGEITMRTLPRILQEIKLRLGASAAHIDLRFPYFLERLAPVSKAAALMDYECWFTAESTDDKDDFILGVRVPITTVCPCSKAISDYGAHNQRGHVEVQVRGREDSTQGTTLIWIEEMVELVERCASAPVYPLLKRADERHVTMQAYDKPVFVEDVVRDVAMWIKADARVAWFHVYVKNQESIHNHNAFAQIEWSRPYAELATISAELELPCEI